MMGSTYSFTVRHEINNECLSSKPLPDKDYFWSKIVQGFSGRSDKKQEEVDFFMLKSGAPAICIVTLKNIQQDYPR